MIPLLLVMFLGLGLIWSGAVEAALGDAYRFSGGPIPWRGLVLGRRSALFRVVRLGGHEVRKARGNAADAVDCDDVFLYCDSSIAPLRDMRRRFNAVMNVLDAMFQYGVSLELNSMLSGTGFLLPDLCILLLLRISMRFRVWVLVIFIEWSQ